MSYLREYTPHREGTHPTFTSTENRCTHIGKNTSSNQIRQFHVDGGLVPKSSAEPRCDYLLLNDDKKSAYYIELKGSDITKAIQQIENTIAKFHHELPSYTIYRRIVYRTGSHDVNSRAVLVWKKKHGRSVRIESRYMEDVL